MRGLIWVILVLFLCVIIIGCKSRPPYVPVESSSMRQDHKDRAIKDSTRIIEKTVTKDSVIIRDSIVYKVNENGDVISKEVYQWREKYRENNYLLKQLQSKYDSLLHTRQDSIRVEVPFPVIEFVEVNKLKWYQEVCIWFTKLALVALALYSVIKYRGKIFAFFRKLFFKI